MRLWLVRASRRFSTDLRRGSWRCGLVNKSIYWRTVLGYKLSERITNTLWHTYLPLVLRTKKVASVTDLARESFLQFISRKTPTGLYNLSAKIRKP